ncbi:hypothetical protein [Chroococcus sp. FPU101]|uniref:DUF6887 family protein n=1 Tax=Chroococcus sp. FPU101 TaxID=1974212 RepID=UPI001A8FC0B7|nr:hypothetical protein [Chroococcus sp. FPU101]GFE68825.1 hypothetical protein CFPU101_14350 [Chroococcus sp. FPU101]
MAEQDFKAMSYDELIDHALSQGEGSQALEEYVRRIKNDPQVITIDPKSNPNWTDQFTQHVRQKYPQSTK